jgi:AcrR family transcriptional regulator
VEASESLLKRKRFEEISVAELAREARSSVGSFYARFPGKDALLDFLDGRGEAEVLEFWDDYFDPERWKGMGAEEVIRSLVTLSVERHRARKGIVKTLSLRLRSEPTPEMLDRARRLNRRVIRGLSSLLDARGSELRHPKPRRAVAFGLVMVVTTIRERVVFQDLELYPGSVSDRELIEELVRAFTGYLGVEVEGKRKR